MGYNSQESNQKVTREENLPNYQVPFKGIFLGHIQTTNANINLHIQAVWSEP